MAIASGNKVFVHTVEETTTGSTPTLNPGDTKILRALARNVNLKKATLESQEVSLFRTQTEVRQGFNQVAGEIGFELSTDSWNDMFRWNMGGAVAAWTAYTAVTNAHGVFITAPSTITRTSGNWITDGYRIGDIIRGSNWTTGANNADFRITAIGGTGGAAITVGETTLATEATAPTKQFLGVGKRLDVGTTFKTFTLERVFSDINEFQVFRGMTVNTVRLSARPDALIGGSFGLLGMSATLNNATTMQSAPTAANSNPPMAAFEAVILGGGSSLNAVTSWDMLMDSQRSLQGVCGSKFSPDVFDGTFKATGTISTMFQNDSFMTFFETETILNPLQLKAVDLNGDFISFVVHRPKFLGHDMDPPLIGPVVQQIPWVATERQITNGVASFTNTFRIQRSTST